MCSKPFSWPKNKENFFFDGKLLEGTVLKCRVITGSMQTSGYFLNCYCLLSPGFNIEFIQHIGNQQEILQK